MRIAAGLLAWMLVLTGCAAEVTDSAESTPAPTEAASPTEPSPTEPETEDPEEPEPTDTSTPKPTPEPKPRTGTRIKVAGSNFGPMLYDGTGQAIYLFDKERTSKSECYGACAEAWPPVFTKGKPRALGDTRQSLLGTTRRTDGRLQVTYAGHPLYFYAHEGKNQVLCHNVEGFGGLWLVVQPNGKPAP